MKRNVFSKIIFPDNGRQIVAYQSYFSPHHKINCKIVFIRKHEMFLVSLLSSRCYITQYFNIPCSGYTVLHYIGFISVHVHTVARIYTYRCVNIHFCCCSNTYIGNAYIRDACIVSQLYGSPRKRLNGCVYLQANYLSIIIELY